MNAPHDLGVTMNGYRTFLASLQFSANRFDIYSGKAFGTGITAKSAPADKPLRDTVPARKQRIDAQTSVR